MLRNFCKLYMGQVFGTATKSQLGIPSSHTKEAGLMPPL